jgi:UPF0755 protein
MQRQIYLFIVPAFFLFFSILTYGIVMSLPVSCNHINHYITIPKDATLSGTSRILNDNLCVNSILFKIVMKISMNEQNIKYGRYDFKSVNNMRDLVDMVTSVTSDRVQITVVEGLRMQEIALYLEKKMKIDVEKFLSLCYDRSLIKDLGLNDINSLEGYLYPDTYKLLKTYTEIDIIKIMVNQFLFNFNENISSETVLSNSDVVILASIIQGEAIYTDEMKKISSVYHNRLNQNMLLQADPTIQYILPKKKRRILVKDTKIDNPYNTYVYKGLPPGPINNPGLDALVAASDPMKTDYLYFVANNEGRHDFNETYRGHLRSKK